HLWLVADEIMPVTDIEEEKTTDLKGDIVSNSLCLSNMLQLNITWLSEPMVDAINTLPLYTDGENQRLYVLSDNNFPLSLDVHDVELEKPNYDMSELEPSLQMRIQIDERLSTSGCCETDSIEDYTNYTPPAPTLTKPSINSIKVQIGNDWPLSVAEEEGTIPSYVTVNIRYKVLAGVSWTTISDQLYSTMDIGYTITGLTANNWVVQIQVENLEGASQWSSSAQITLP
ncbi:MAG: hypothetical protein JNM00_08330, partial [Flavobacteriales bacterium]|nr:hypothetical protein [Flavobacteriales bacterium]